jgi:hypothetical protein
MAGREGYPIKKDKNLKNRNVTEVGGSFYHPSYYQGSTQVEKGLAETHEQVSDNYTTGTVDQLLDEDKSE